VWLILVVVLLFTAFPPAFARIMTLLHIPLTLMLFGIVLRGSAFTFRSYDSRRDDVQRRWSGIFAIASTVTPLLLGAVLGAIATGSVNEDRLTHSSFLQSYVWPWLAPFPLGVGLLALVLFAFLAAVYLTLEAGDDALRDDFRTRALWAGGAAAVVATLDLILARSGAPLVWSALTEGSIAMAFRITATAAAVLAMGALLRRSYRFARIAAAVEVSLIVWGWALGQFPYLVPPDLTIRNASAPAATLDLLIIALLIGLAVLLPSLKYLFKIFKAG
jgi:cytochrome d ubiquinol oxidase subunit II